MNILQVIDFLPETSGGARFVVNLSKALLEKNINVDVLLIDGHESHFLRELEESNIHVIKLSKNANRFNPYFAYKISKYLDKYDVVHVHIFPSSYQVALGRILNKNSAPIVFTEHNSFNRRASNFLFKYIENFIYKKFSHIVCLSQQVFDFVYSNLTVKADKLTIIENAIDVNAINCALPSKRTQYKLNENDFLLLMSARFTSQKNHKVIVDTLKNLPSNIKVLFAGEGTGKNDIELLVKENNLSDRVFFLGSRGDIFNLMHMADVNILASNFEGLSLAALEAMSTGKPFVASNVDGLDFVVNNPQYLFNNNTESLGKLILKLYNDKFFYDECAKYTYNRSKNFDMKIMVEKYIKVYENQIISKDLK
ncbi:glycosyltransferase family 4 protein [Acinetobacter sp. CFCC 11171]|uniref:glycosyltransferase family 4 protein n=1 Tax=Acinetobacter sp. CFCC 11171 TaxID=1775558 RepID=UPI000DCFF390|nr:glycosyltransferase family 4 protein [Acinetobacter sp. CFCC 11171]